MTPGQMPYLSRLLDGRLAALFAELPAILIVGPRAAGKTTTASQIARNVVRLDRQAEAAAFVADPDAALAAQAEPVLLDEWQQVPGVLAAVRRAVEQDPRPGRFLLTGSVRTDLEGDVWPGTGRVVRLKLYGTTLRELSGRTSRPPFIDRLAQADASVFSLPNPIPDLVAYIEAALRGGFPYPLLRGLSDTARQAWLESYIEQLLTHDVQGLVRGPSRLRQYFEALALNSGGVANATTLYTAAGVNYRTAEHYQDLLKDLFVVDVLPAFENNRLHRLTKTPKRYLVDPALIAAALRLDMRGVLRDGNLLGRVLDTFVVAQIRPELEVSMLRPRLYHLREKNGRREVDIVGETSKGVVAMEVKATAAPRKDDAAHLIALRDELGTSFLGGAVLHTGPGVFQLSERILALPICAIWG